MAADSFSNTAYLIGQPTRSNVRRVLGEVSLRGLPHSPGYELIDDELENILWEIAEAAAGILEKHMPTLQAVAEQRNSAAKAERQSRIGRSN
jgi:hypothetical protein